MLRWGKDLDCRNFSSRLEPYRGKCLASISFQILGKFPPNQLAAATVPLHPVNMAQTLPTKVSLLSLLFQNLQKIPCHRCRNPREEDDFLVNDRVVNFNSAWKRTVAKITVIDNSDNHNVLGQQPRQDNFFHGKEILETLPQRNNITVITSLVYPVLSWFYVLPYLLKWWRRR